MDGGHTRTSAMSSRSSCIPPPLVLPTMPSDPPPSPLLMCPADVLQPARVTVVVRVRPPEAGPGRHDAGVAVFPAVGGADTIIVDRDGGASDGGERTRYAQH